MIYAERLSHLLPDLAPLQAGSEMPRINARRSGAIVRNHLHQLWLSRKMKDDSTAVFYKYNEFRFSNCHGWAAAAQFLRTHLEIIESIRHLTVHVPFEGRILTLGRPRRELSNMTLSELKEQPIKDYIGVGSNVGLPASRELLRRAQNLQTLKLILPRGYQIFPHEESKNRLGGAWRALEGIKSDHPDLKVTLVILQKQAHWDDVPWNVQLEGSPLGDPWNHQPVLLLAKKNGWKIVEQFYDKEGRYPAGTS